MPDPTDVTGMARSPGWVPLAIERPWFQCAGFWGLLLPTSPGRLLANCQPTEPIVLQKWNSPTASAHFGIKGRGSRVIGLHPVSVDDKFEPWHRSGHGLPFPGKGTPERERVQTTLLSAPGASGERRPVARTVVAALGRP
jgi:hypothetical protein